LIELKRTAQERLLGRKVDAILTTTDSGGFAGRRVLITGGGGSVGSELARQMAGCQPGHLVLFDHAEYNLFRIESELRDVFPGLPLTVILGDVSRAVDIAAACREAQPHIVFHAAAYKHVTLAERSVVAAARTNVLGTVQTLKAARDVGARFVFISSDKAAESRSVMGATKRFAELVTLDLSTPRFPTMVTRFGNILGSSGSVVEIMLRCVERGRPVPVTDPDATRFFMTGEEAASLVMKAAQIGEGGEVFWLDMGDAVRIGDLVDRLITYATPKGAPRVPVETIGLRPGEKVREELTNQGLEMKRTVHHRIWRARQRDVPRLEVYRALRRLSRACAKGDTAGALSAIRLAVSDYVPSEAVLELAAALKPRPTSEGVVEPSRSAR